MNEQVKQTAESGALFPMTIGGKAVITGSSFAVTNPATGEINGTFTPNVGAMVPITCQCGLQFADSPAVRASAGVAIENIAESVSRAGERGLRSDRHIT